MLLYEIESEYREFIDEANRAAEENGGVIPDHIAEKLEQVEVDRDKKIGAYGRWYKSLNAMHGAIQDERKRLQAKEASVERQKDWVKAQLQAAVGAGNKYRDAVSTMYWLQPKSVEIVEYDSIPKKYQIPQPDAIDKKSISADIKSGCEVDGAKLTTKDVIVIR